jgi:hypothetical protein
MGNISLTKAQLQAIILKEQAEQENYMFFSNLEQIERQCKLLRQVSPEKINELLSNGHDWADDHVSSAKENMDQVFDFIMNETKGGDNEHETMRADADQFSLNEDGKMKSGESDPCWKGYEMVGKKTKNGRQVPNCVPKNESIEGVVYEDDYGVVEETKYISDDLLTEAEYQGRKVQLGKIMQGDIKKFKVYVKNDKGKVVKVNFGFGGKSAHGKVMKIKKNNPERRKSFRARMGCDSPGPRWKPRYWACRTW